MDLTVGPNPFFWPAEDVRGFYEGLTAAPVRRVVIGEWICSKRLPFWQGEIPGAVERLRAAGKDVALTTLALVTLLRERRQTAELFETGLPVEINDLSALRHLPGDTPFWVGPMVNVYNEGTLEWLARRGARRICLPPELPLASVALLARAGLAAGVAIEVWGHGRAPLAISGRCYHARLHDRAKDNCQFVCGMDPDGREVDTLDGRAFLTVNGVQVLGHAVTTALRQVAALRAAGVAALRLSPQVGDFGGICAAYTAVADGTAGADEAEERLRRLLPGVALADGFALGQPGVDWPAA